jgi:hypothetical protein
MIERSIDRWNERDRDGWLALFDSAPFEFEGLEGRADGRPASSGTRLAHVD